MAGRKRNIVRNIVTQPIGTAGTTTVRRRTTATTGAGKQQMAMGRTGTVVSAMSSEIAGSLNGLGFLRPNLNQAQLVQAIDLTLRAAGWSG